MRRQPSQAAMPLQPAMWPPQSRRLLPRRLPHLAPSLMSQHQPLLRLPRHQQPQRLPSLRPQLSKRALLQLQRHLQRQLLQLQRLLRLLRKHLLRHQPQRPLRRQWRPSQRQRLRQPQHRRQPQRSRPQHPLLRRPQSRPPRPRAVSSRAVVRPKRLAHRRVWLHVRYLRRPIGQRPRCRQACLLPVRPALLARPVQRLRHGPHRQRVARFLRLLAAHGRCRLLAGQSHRLRVAPVPAPVHLQVALVAIRSRLVPAVPVALVVLVALVLVASRHAQAALVVLVVLVLVASRREPVALVVLVALAPVVASRHAQAPAAVLVVLVVLVAVAPVATTAHALAANVAPRARARAAVVVVTSTSCSRSSPVTTPRAMLQFQMAPSSSSVACRLRSSLPS